MVTPDTIPNSAVKHCSGDGTRKGRVASRQHRVFDFGFYSVSLCLSDEISTARWIFGLKPFFIADKKFPWYH